MTDIVLGVDVGSSSAKTVAVDRRGTILARASRPYDLRHPRPGWAEQNADDWYRCAARTMFECVAGLEDATVAGIAVDGPAHNVALVDGAGRVLAPVIHWSDLRSAPQASRLETEMGGEILRQTLHRANASWTLAQLRWLREERPRLLDRARWLLVTKDYVRFRLTAEPATDPYDAVGTQLYDVAAGRWSPELCAAAGVRVEDMLEVLPSTARGGVLTSAAAEDTGVPVGTPVFVGSGDTVTEGLGVGMVDVADTLFKLGTSGTVMTITSGPEPDPDLLTYPHVVPDRWIAMAATNSGAGTLRWFRRTFLDGRDGDWSVERIGALAGESPPGARGVIFHPFLSGERSPYWDAGLRAAFSGLGVTTDLRDLARACLEGVALSLRDGSTALASAGHEVRDVRLVGGGARSDIWAQIVADVVGIPVARYGMAAPAYGTALVAAVALGWFAWDENPSPADPAYRRFEPAPIQRARYDELFDRYRQMVPHLSVREGSDP